MTFEDWVDRSIPMTNSERTFAWFAWKASAKAEREAFAQRRNSMTLTKEQQQTMLDAAKPLMQWMSEHCHPHCTAHVDWTTVELAEGVATNCTEEFLRD